jgi:hypothetical protein
MQATAIPGYPLFPCWGRWGGIETTERGIRKAFLLLPHVQMGQASLKKFSGQSTVEMPLDVAMSEIVNPYNCKVSVVPSLNTDSLKDGGYYIYLLALKPAAVNGGRNGSTPYWDGHLKAFSKSINSFTEFKAYLDAFVSNQTQWNDMQVVDSSDDEQEVS